MHFTASFISLSQSGPKQNTMTDFWQMIWQENIHQIVMLTNLQEGTRVFTMKAASISTIFF